MTESDFIAHFGVKGMRWGVRQAKPRGAIRRGLTKANTALDAGSKVISEGEKHLIFLPHQYRQQAASATQHRVLGVAREINKSPKYHGKDLKTNPRLKRSYHDAVQSHAISIYKEELGRARGQAVVDTIDALFSPSGDSMTFTASRSSFSHADGSKDISVLRLDFERDEFDQITNVVAVDLIDDSLEQMDISSDVLAHFGVKGMRWGVRRDDPSGAHGPTGGTKKPIAVSEDHARTTEIRSKISSGGTKTVSNKELQDVIQRMNLEQQYSRLSSQKTTLTTGYSKAKQIIGVAKTIQEVHSLATGGMAKAIAKAIADNK